MSITQNMYRSESGVSILSGEEIQNKDLMALADAKMVTGDIVSYSKDSFLFKTDNLMLPGFISESFGFGISIIGLPISYEKLSVGFRKSFNAKLDKIIRSNEKFEDIKASIGLANEMRNLQEAGRHATADILGTIFNGDIIRTFNIGLTTYRDQDGQIFVTISSSASSKEVERIFQEYMSAVLIENKKWRIKIDNEKMCYCPIESSIGTQISTLIEFINKASKQIRNIIAFDIICLMEEELGESLEEYIFEENFLSGIKIGLNSVTYFKNVCSPEGKAVFVQEKSSERYALCYLKEYIEYVPKELDLQQNAHLFENVITMESMVKF